MGSERRRRLALGPLLGLAVALPMALWLRDFTVDDALISARYAAHLQQGLGYRFNPNGPVTDGVTPLGWAHLLAPLSGGSVMGAWTAARAMGLAAWWFGAALLGDAVERMGGSRRRFFALALVAASAPLGAWAASGMETGVVLGVASVAVYCKVRGRAMAAAAAAGFVAMWRPECLPWALLFSGAPSPRDESPRVASDAVAAGRAALLRAACAGVPFVVVAVVRAMVFGRPAPLSIYAKPSDWAHGWRYALGTALLSGVIAALWWKRAAPWVRGLQLALGAHFVAIALAGGDWMPLARLAVVAVPTLVVVAAVALRQAWIGPGIRLALALAGQLYLALVHAPRATGVGAKRRAMIRELGPSLRQGTIVAGVDVGWIGAAHPGTVIDLAGVTDPRVAMLAGGHTSKAIDAYWLEARGVDTLVLWVPGEGALPAPWWRAPFGRVIERRFARSRSMRSSFAAVARHERKPRTLVLRRAAGAGN